MEFGFSSYPKFFRACLLCYGKTPHQLELEILEELLEPRMNTDEHGWDQEIKVQNETIKMAVAETEGSEVKTG